MIKTNNAINKYVVILCSFTLALLPILAPYEFFGPFSMSHLLLFISYIVTILIAKRLYIVKELFFLVSIHLIVSLIAFAMRINQMFVNEIPPSLLFITLTTFMIMQVIRTASIYYFIKSSLVIGLLACVFLFYQYILMWLGINPPDGKIVFLSLNQHSGWAEIDINNIYMRRLHSFFPEPSYFALYLLPLLSYTLNKGKILISLILYSTLLLSSSSLGIITGSILLLINLFNIRSLKSILSTVAISLFLVFLYYLVKDAEFFRYSIEKIFNLEEDSNIRLVGYIDYFKLLPDLYQIIGVGSNQFTYYFHEYNLKNYSNAFVLSLLNFGVIGFLSLVIFISTLLLRYKDKRVYILIFIIVCFVDAFLYNMYFFYILSFILISNIHKKELSSNKIKIDQ